MMWLPMPSTDDLERETSRLDTAVSPRHLTNWDDSTADVVFRAANAPAKFTSTNPRVATADLMPRGIFQGLGATDWPVQISGHSPGTAIITPLDGKGKVIWGVTLEVDVLRRQEYYVNFYLVTDWLGGTTDRGASHISQSDIPLINDAFAPANIGFILHNVRHVSMSVHFDGRAANVQDLNRRMDQVVRAAQQMNGAPHHIHVFRVKMLQWLDGVRVGVDAQGYTQGRTIVVEDDAGGAVLPHEIGHALGLKHNKRSIALMNEAPTGMLLTKEDIRKAGMLR